MLKDKSGWAVLFDLDETLVLTSKLEELRRKRLWQEVYASFGQTAIPPRTHECLERLRVENVATGVVTKSPRTYAEKLVRHHGLDIPVLVAYHDVRHRKPHPEAILLATSKLSIPPENCIYVGDDADDVAAARAAGAGIIVVCWGS